MNASVDVVDASPRFPFRTLSMDAVVVVNEAAAGGAHADDQRFACAFDPSLKHVRSLVLRFSPDGSSAFEEVSRADVLRMTQEAALDTGRGGGSRHNAPPTRVHQTKLLAHTTSSAFGATIIDVQRVHARDIRKLDTAFSVSNEPSIELRNQAVLMNADPVRAILMRDTCLVFVPDGADSLLSILRESFRETTGVGEQGDAPFEFRCVRARIRTLAGADGGCSPSVSELTESGSDSLPTD